jgi:hypothetical protein
LYTGTLIKDLFASVERVERTAGLQTAISTSEFADATEVDAAENKTGDAISISLEAE